MEVFIRGVPERANSNQLTGALRPPLVSLDIHDWFVHKTKGKNFGSLTFLKLTDGQKFLDKHGSLLNTLGRAYLPYGRIQLMFKGLVLSFSLSRNKVDSFALKSLELDAKERLAKNSHIARPEPPPVAAPPKKKQDLVLTSVSCGSWEYISSKVTFVSYQSWVQPATVKFLSRAIMIMAVNGQIIEFPYSVVYEIVLSRDIRVDLLLSLREAPRFFQDGIHQAGTNADDQFLEAMSALGLQRQGPGPRRARVASLDRNHASISSTCLVYRLTFNSTDIASQLQSLTSARGLPPLVRRRVPVVKSEISFQSQMDHLLQSLNTPTLAFQIKFQVQRLAQDGFLPPKVVSDLLPTIRDLSARCTLSACVNTIRRLFNQIPYRCVEQDPSSFSIATLKTLLLENERRIKSGEFSQANFMESEALASIHRVHITPAGFHLSGPQPENNNRVLRKYPQHHDNFVRVSFSDEDGEPVRYNAQISNDLIYNDRFKKILNNGFSLAGLRFSFLGFSHSSLRAQSCWFMAPFIQNGSLFFDRQLIQDLGDFSMIRCPAKCAARIGQAFSETPTAVTIAPGVCREIPDIERNGRVFSDGAGTMSRSVMEKIWDRMPSQNKGKPTLFQIRYGGAKGMISLDSRLVGDVLNLRPSMTKFPGSKSLDIELCNGAYRALPFYLNQQSIKILEDMGVDDEFFLHNQTKEVERLRLTTSNSHLASKFLKRHAIGSRIHFPWFIEKLAVLNIPFTSDTFLRDVVEVAVLIELRALKYKARIPIEDGFTLQGIMDETGYLQEGEIFCIVEKQGKPVILTGRNLIVTRSPALHPGDIQVVTAVKVPSTSPLMQLRNCICFSQKGSRDLPSMLSGGDLDGDLYQILFDSQARAKRTFTPADYPRPKPVDLGRRVEREDMTDFFVTFMETDQLGRIANNHKILADRHPDGTLNPECLTLAEMHSTAVDFSKSGVPVDLSRMPRMSGFRPDFMAFGPHTVVETDKPVTFSGPKQNTLPGDEDEDEEDEGPMYRFYESDKILGKLFRQIDEQEIFSEVQSRTQNIKSKHTSVVHAIWSYVQKTCPYHEWTQHIVRARGIRDEYQESIHNLAWEYSPSYSKPLSEREVFIGNILGKAGAQSKKQHDLSVSMKEKLETDQAYTVNCIIGTEAEDMDESLERSMACLHVSLEESDGFEGTSGKVEKLISFRYVAAAICLREIEKARSTNSLSAYDPKVPTPSHNAETWIRQYGSGYGT